MSLCVYQALPVLLQVSISPKWSILRKLMADTDDLTFFHATHTHTHTHTSRTASTQNIDTCAVLRCVHQVEPLNLGSTWHQTIPARAGSRTELGSLQNLLKTNGGKSNSSSCNTNTIIFLLIGLFHVEVRFLFLLILLVEEFWWCLLQHWCTADLQRCSTVILEGRVRL